LDPWHFRKYVKKIEQKRDRHRARDISTGGHIVCPGSYAMANTKGLMGIHSCEIFRRPSLKIQGRFSTHAACDKCGVAFKLWGDGWTNGTPPIFSLDGERMNQLMLVLNGVMAELERVWQQEALEIHRQQTSMMTTTSPSEFEEAEEK